MISGKTSYERDCTCREALYVHRPLDEVQGVPSLADGGLNLLVPEDGGDVGTGLGASDNNNSVFTLLSSKYVASLLSSPQHPPAENRKYN